MILFGTNETSGSGTRVLDLYRQPIRFARFGNESFNRGYRVVEPATKWIVASPGDESTAVKRAMCRNGIKAFPWE